MWKLLWEIKQFRGVTPDSRVQTNHLSYSHMDKFAYEPNGPSRLALICGFYVARISESTRSIFTFSRWDASPSQGFPWHKLNLLVPISRYFFTLVERATVKVVSFPRRTTQCPRLGLDSEANALGCSRNKQETSRLLFIQ